MTLWDTVLSRLLRRGITRGRLSVTFADGRTRAFGQAAAGEPDVAVRLGDAALSRALVTNPELAMGEAYTDGRLTIAGDDLRGLLTLAMRNGPAARQRSALRGLMALHRAAARIGRHNPLSAARQNVAHHYDLSGELYQLFLDAQQQYTCAYFRSPDASLEQAQSDKMAHIGRKLFITPGMRVLDIGCGFGTLALTLARDFGAKVTGITLSEVQLAEARDRAAAAGLADRVEFRLQDYRAVTETFDRVVSVGMMEHVGRADLPVYFGQVAHILAPDGVALIHYIGRPGPPRPISPWFAKYIFPGAYCPSLSEVLPTIERGTLRIADIEVWQGHYERTLAHWHARFMANAARAAALYDDRFVRMWRFYLLSAEKSFSEGQLVIHQLQLTRAPGTLPATRDYLYPPGTPTRVVALPLAAADDRRPSPVAASGAG